MAQKQKYLQYYDLMRQQNAKIFTQFQKIHDQYQIDKSNSEEFHTQGTRVLDIIRDWERRLCSGMERGNFAGYSSKLSEKFWEKVKKDLPLVDEIGVRISYQK